MSKNEVGSPGESVPDLSRQFLPQIETRSITLVLSIHSVSHQSLGETPSHALVRFETVPAITANVTKLRRGWGYTREQGEAPAEPHSPSCTRLSWIFASQRPPSRQSLLLFLFFLLFIPIKENVLAGDREGDAHRDPDVAAHQP